MQLLTGLKEYYEAFVASHTASATILFNNSNAAPLYFFAEHLTTEVHKVYFTELHRVTQ